MKWTMVEIQACILVHRKEISLQKYVWSTCSAYAAGTHAAMKTTVFTERKFIWNIFLSTVQPSL